MICSNAPLPKSFKSKKNHPQAIMRNVTEQQIRRTKIQQTIQQKSNKQIEHVKF